MPACSFSHLVSFHCACVFWGHSQFCACSTMGRKGGRVVHALYNVVVNFRLLPGTLWTLSHRARIALLQGNTTATQRSLCSANGDQFPLQGHVSHQPHAESPNKSSFLPWSIWKPWELGCFRSTPLEALTELYALSDFFCTALLLQGPQCPEVISS